MVPYHYYKHYKLILGSHQILEFYSFDPWLIRAYCDFGECGHLVVFPLSKNWRVLNSGSISTPTQNKIHPLVVEPRLKIPLYIFLDTLDSLVWSQNVYEQENTSPVFLPGKLGDKGRMVAWKFEKIKSGIILCLEMAIALI